MERSTIRATGKEKSEGNIILAGEERIRTNANGFDQKRYGCAIAVNTVVFLRDFNTLF
jgi:hypothetical protein